ncbi:methyltransferase [Patescibacteria group bacterium]|nr:methyltransferase [Patescibacteria group bacterium]MBU1684743.1 methyltransferase [Patescibacteria group bacterium]
MVRETGENVSEQIKALLPEKYQYIYETLDQQHFGKKSYGSRFYENPDTGAKNLRELLQRAYEQRGTLEGDDKDFFISQGVSKEALLSSHRYLKVAAEGKLGIASVSSLPPETKVRVVEIKPGEELSLVVGVESDDDLPEVEYGTIIIGPDEEGKPERIKTAHPGAPAPIFRTSAFQKDSVITAQEVIDKLGPNQHVILQTRTSSLANELSDFSKELGIPTLVDKVNRGLDPMGIFALEETNKKVGDLCEKMGAEYTELLNMTKDIQLSGPWKYIKRFKKADDPVTRAWMILNAVSTMGQEREKDFTEKEFLADIDRIHGKLNEAIDDPDKFFVTARPHITEESKKRYRVEQGVPVSEQTNGFIAMGINGFKAGVYQDPDGMLFVGSANPIDDAVIESWGLRAVVKNDRRVVQGKTINREVTFYENENGETLAKKVHPGFVVVISRSPELAKAIAKVGLVGEKAEKPSAEALGHKFYAPTSMDVNAEEESAEAVYGPLRGKIARLLEQEPLPENATAAERFYYMFLQVRRFVVYRDAVKKISDRKAKQGEKMTEEEMEELWEKVKRKQTQKMEELKFMGEIMTPLMAKLPKRADRVMDMAGGTGDLALATAMSMMEAGHPISKATIIDPFVTTTRDFTDFVIEHLPNSEKFKEIIDPQAKSLQEAQPSKNDVVVAKHSCGTLTDDIIEQWMASESPMLCIMTCCHDKAKNESARYDLSQDEWQKLCKTSSKTNSEDPETWKKGMEAMTKLDTARVDYLKRHGFEAELHQTDQFPKGDVIVARRKKY